MLTHKIRKGRFAYLYILRKKCNKRRFLEEITKDVHHLKKKKLRDNSTYGFLLLKTLTNVWICKYAVAMPCVGIWMVCSHVLVQLDMLAMAKSAQVSIVGDAL